MLKKLCALMIVGTSLNCYASLCGPVKVFTSLGIVHFEFLGDSSSDKRLSKTGAILFAPSLINILFEEPLMDHYVKDITTRSDNYYDYDAYIPPVGESITILCFEGKKVKPSKIPVSLEFEGLDTYQQSKDEKNVVFQARGLDGKAYSRGGDENKPTQKVVAPY